MLRLYIGFQTLLMCEEGQDLAEYALVVALIAFGAVAGVTRFSVQVAQAFSTISSDFASSVA
jgi:pilus assembly protein Flp/PilA